MKAWRSITQNKMLLLASGLFLSLWLFLYIGWEVTEYGVGDPAWISFDQSIQSALAAIRSNALTDAMLTFTYMGSTISITFIAFIALLFAHFKGFYSERRLIISTSLGSLLLIRSAKAVFGRERPSPDTWLAPATGLSFPSGHTVESFAVLGVLFFILGRSCEQRGQRWTLWMLGVFFVFAVGLSRVYLGVHFTSDVLGGFALGLSILLCSLAVDRHRQERR